MTPNETCENCGNPVGDVFAGYEAPLCDECCKALSVPHDEQVSSGVRSAAARQPESTPSDGKVSPPGAKCDTLSDYYHHDDDAPTFTTQGEHTCSTCRDWIRRSGTSGHCASNAPVSDCDASFGCNQWVPTGARNANDVQKLADQIKTLARFHCVTQLQADSWEYREKRDGEAPNEDDLVFASELAKLDDDVVFWMMVADGVNHDPRCPNHFNGDTTSRACLRCELAEERRLSSEKDAKLAELEARIGCDMIVCPFEERARNAESKLAEQSATLARLEKEINELKR